MRGLAVLPAAGIRVPRLAPRAALHCWRGHDLRGHPGLQEVLLPVVVAIPVPVDHGAGGLFLPGPDRPSDALQRHGPARVRLLVQHGRRRAGELRHRRAVAARLHHVHP
ncbi:unnamed protein product, partial [Heterosigma akashiwo]